MEAKISTPLGKLLTIIYLSSVHIPISPLQQCHIRGDNRIRQHQQYKTTLIQWLYYRLVSEILYSFQLYSLSSNYLFTFQILIHFSDRNQSTMASTRGVSRVDTIPWATRTTRSSTPSFMTPIPCFNLRLTSATNLRSIRAAATASSSLCSLLKVAILFIK